MMHRALRFLSTLKQQGKNVHQHKDKEQYLFGPFTRRQFSQMVLKLQRIYSRQLSVCHVLQIFLMKRMYHYLFPGKRFKTLYLEHINETIQHVNSCSKIKEIWLFFQIIKTKNILESTKLLIINEQRFLKRRSLWKGKYPLPSLHTMWQCTYHRTCRRLYRGNSGKLKDLLCWSHCMLIYNISPTSRWNGTNNQSRDK